MLIISTIFLQLIDRSRSYHPSPAVALFSNIPVVHGAHELVDVKPLYSNLLPLTVEGGLQSIISRVMHLISVDHDQSNGGLREKSALTWLPVRNAA